MSTDSKKLRGYVRKRAPKDKNTVLPSDDASNRVTFWQTASGEVGSKRTAEKNRYYHVRHHTEASRRTDNGDQEALSRGRIAKSSTVQGSKAAQVASVDGCTRRTLEESDGRRPGEDDVDHGAIKSTKRNAKKPKPTSFFGKLGFSGSSLVGGQKHRVSTEKARDTPPRSSGDKLPNRPRASTSSRSHGNRTPAPPDATPYELLHLPEQGSSGVVGGYFAGSAHKDSDDEKPEIEKLIPIDESDDQATSSMNSPTEPETNRSTHSRSASRMRVGDTRSRSRARSPHSVGDQSSHDGIFHPDDRDFSASDSDERFERPGSDRSHTDRDSIRSISRHSRQSINTKGVTHETNSIMHDSRTGSLLGSIPDSPEERGRTGRPSSPSDPRAGEKHSKNLGSAPPAGHVPISVFERRARASSVSSLARLRHGQGAGPHIERLPLPGEEIMARSQSRSERAAPDAGRSQYPEIKLSTLQKQIKAPDIRKITDHHGIVKEVSTR